MSYEAEGKLIKKYDTESKTASFRAREFVIEMAGQYPQFIKFQLVQDRCDVIDPLQEGDMIKVSFDLRGREWNGKYFTNLNAWRVSKAEPQAPGNTPPPPPAATDSSFPSPTDEPSAPQNNDDLPF